MYCMGKLFYVILVFLNLEHKFHRLWKKNKKVIVNNSTNINKVNNHLSLKSLNIKKTMTNDIWKPGPGLRQAQKSGWVKSG